ncbi:(deoxy)nucleoside triphosphate pyrophosphohydrolase [Sphingomonas sp. KR1UV-12]|uniref:8-oxo-dGTP diphosphatase n=1 Tax=Sphingomonas aurea TaxID=3063994 RepID=A0ABT9EJ92_9SPHN|nr:(deoxy)nucleoside triphosphate pyrophosphohydrolase [Sphingomonas sp. KR1UV-12]MDP1027006.1 (deoxy)nucleoside triphosphate pyrophosphohydrolase [Sphingomonas sp. KR1UV-12]
MNAAAMYPVQNVAAAIACRGDRVLVTRRAPGQKMAGLWEFPGGKLEPGETPQTCIVREIAEELSVDCTAGGILMEHRHTYSGGAINLIAVIVTLTSDGFRLSVHDDARWVPASDLLSLELAPADIPVARRLRDLFKRGALQPSASARMS